ncbi:MAG: hypothetical protein Q9163_005642, partial [Psora crenata]
MQPEACQSRGLRNRAAILTDGLKDRPALHVDGFSQAKTAERCRCKVSGTKKSPSQSTPRLDAYMPDPLPTDRKLRTFTGLRIHQEASEFGGGEGYTKALIS